MITKIHPKLIRKNISELPRKWCSRPYPGQSHGCPNVGKKRSLRGIRKDLQSRVIRECPRREEPQIRLLNEIFDLSKPVYIIYQIFNMGAYAEKLRTGSNKLKTRGQWYNKRYWQQVARKKLYDKIEKFLDSHKGTIVDICPEAHGVNFVTLMPEVGIQLKWYRPWPPEHDILHERYLENKAHQICLGGYPKKNL
jgi:hypothetical protein